MNHNLKISVSKQPKSDAAVSCKKVSIREKLLTKLFGPLHKLTILIPGDNVENVSIAMVEEKGGKENYAK